MLFIKGRDFIGRRRHASVEEAKESPPTHSGTQASLPSDDLMGLFSRYGTFAVLPRFSGATEVLRGLAERAARTKPPAVKPSESDESLTQPPTSS